MERQDIEIIQSHLEDDSHLAGLYKEHVDFERRLAKLDNKLFLTPEEEVERKELQKRKLKGKDRIEQILRKYRKKRVGP